MSLETYATRSLIAVAFFSLICLFFYVPKDNPTGFSHSGTQAYNRIQPWHHSQKQNTGR